MSQNFPIVDQERVAGPYTASAGQTAFTYGFPLLDAADLLVETATAAVPGAWTPATLGVDYTLTPAPPAAGGTVLFTTGRLVGSRVRMFGAAVIENTQDVVPNGKVDSLRLNRFFDRMTLWVQELRRDIDALLVRIGLIDGEAAIQASQAAAASATAAAGSATAAANSATAAANSAASMTKATQAQAEAGTDDTAYMTPLKVAQQRAAAEAASSGARLRNVVYVTTSQVYTPPSWLKSAIFEVQAAGGGSFNCTGGSTPLVQAGGGAGSGTWGKVRKTKAQIGASATVTIGAAGIGGASPTNASDTTISFAAGGSVTAPGGAAPTSVGTAGNTENNSRGGAGGAAGTGFDVTVPGQNGSASFRTSGNGGVAGLGGSCPRGNGGAPNDTGTFRVASPGRGYGAGASGAYSGLASLAAGADGAPAIVIIEEYE